MLATSGSQSHHRPVAHVRVETATFNRLRKLQTVNHDLHIAWVGCPMHLVGDIKRLIESATVRQYGIDGQLVRIIQRGTMSEHVEV